MRGDSHCFVANLALACLEEKERHILYPRWGGIEGGATLSDHFRDMREIAEAGSSRRHLIHRCYIDSKDVKDHGCATMAFDHASGSIGFIEDYMKGDLDDAYTEDQFLENLGMYLGIASHHIADMCTPVHVGHVIDHRSLGWPSLPRFHAKVERDIARLQRRVRIRLHKPKKVAFSKEYFWGIATGTYEDIFNFLPKVYRDKQEADLELMVSKVLTSAVRHTADAWHTILASSDMAKRSWSMQPFFT